MKNTTRVYILAICILSLNVLMGCNGGDSSSQSGVNPHPSPNGEVQNEEREIFRLCNPKYADPSVDAVVSQCCPARDAAYQKRLTTSLIAFSSVGSYSVTLLNLKSFQKRFYLSADEHTCIADGMCKEYK